MVMEAIAHKAKNKKHQKLEKKKKNQTHVQQ